MLKIKDWVVIFITAIITILGILAIFNQDWGVSTKNEEKSQIEANFSSSEVVEVRGQASWYEYCLDSGWCNTDHYTCAVRHNINGELPDMPNAISVERKEFVTVIAFIEPGLTREVDCLITDFGPSADVFPDRVVDLSPKAFSELAPLGWGIIKDVIVIKRDEYKTNQ